MDFICQEKPFFRNPLKVPLNELTLEIKTYRKMKKLPKDKDLEQMKDSLMKYYDIKTEKIRALDEYWIQKKHSYHVYQPYYSEVSSAENEFFISKNKLFLNNLKFLLQCSYHQFWCYIIYEPKVVIILNSFITNPISWYELKNLKGDHLILYENLHELMARILLRLLTFQESATEFMESETVMKYLQTFQLFTCPNIVNLCILYGQSNNKLVNRVMELFFNAKQEKHYKKDVKQLLDHALLVFEMVGGQVCGFEDNATIVPFNITSKPVKFDPFWIEEVVSYIFDTAASLNAFLSCCNPATQMALSMGIPFRLAYFHNRVFEELYKLTKTPTKLPFDWSGLRNRIFDYIAVGRSEFVNTFHIFIAYLIDNIIQTGNQEKQMDYVEQYLKLISSIFEDEFFLYDYHYSKEIDAQLQMITDFCPAIDQMRINYIMECLTNIIKLPSKPLKTINVPKAEMQGQEPMPGTSGIQNHTQNKKQFNEQEIEQLIHEVLDTLPHLGDGFVLKCLELYNYQSHEVIAAVLDQNLSPLLNDIPQDLIRIPPEPKPAKPILAHKGKKPQYKDTMQLLNDKTGLQEVKDFVLKSSNAYYDMYDDEYDDRYDDGVSMHFREKSEEPDLYKYMENRFDGYEVVSDPSSTDEEDNEISINNTGKSKAFCEDPALLRERREAQRKQFNNHHKSNDVAGKPKGQGQEKNVLNNRNKKNVNKSSRANHNRKSGAQWKRNKGMFPS